MKQHLNTLFVTTPGSFVGRDGAAVEVRLDGETRIRVPAHNLAGIVCFGHVTVSPAAMALCSERDVALTFLSQGGRFLARVSGFSSGNVLLRREQYRHADMPARSLDIARTVVAAKIANSRGILQRACREYKDMPQLPEVEAAVIRLAKQVTRARECDSLDQLRGVEGESAAWYFGVFDHLIRVQKDTFGFCGRTRRPPEDRVNALLSFLYAILAHDVRAACESTGLDAAVGFLHRDRPGRPGLALDLMEELRAVLVDRLVLSLINRQQVRPDGFRFNEAGGVEMDDETRKQVLVAYQERKQEVLTHPFLEERTTLGLVPYLQARLLARFIRGDMDAYPAFVWR